ncbi:MAG: glycosyltransferase family 1 protein [Bacteroidales bacterium]|nr:glycosyltransferase family 1 protein [Bacteroidales bacterium]
MKPKILIVCCNGFEKGGIQAVIMSIVRILHADYDFDAIVFSEGDQFYTKEFEEYGSIYHFKDRYPANKLRKTVEEMSRELYYSKVFSSFLSSHGPYQAIHCHNYFEAAPFLKVAKQKGIPVRIAHCHNVAPIHPRKNPLYHKLIGFYKKEILKNATDYVACSKAAGTYLFDNHIVRVINNAIDLGNFSYEKSIIEKRDTIKFIHVGRYSGQKNQLFLLEVFKEYHNMNSDSKLTLIGSGKLSQKIERRIKELGLDGSIEMLPSDSDVPSYLAVHDCMIFPSMYEGLGISLIEAQAMGLHCFVSEAIQKEADLGLCIFLKLEDGAHLWAKSIDEYIQKNGIEKKIIDMKSFDIKLISEQYRKIYAGESCL